MNQLEMFTSNYIINVGVVSWASAQIIKTLLTLFFTKKINLERLVGAGGMPSSHSALTVSIAIAIARKLGFDSPLFGLAFAFAAVVMYDAMGVRRAAGEQAKVLNKMIFEFSIFHLFGGGEQEDSSNKMQENNSTQENESTDENSSPLIDKELKEFLGHTPFEVLGGCLLGFLVAIFMPVV